MFAWLWLIRGSRSARVDNASEGVMTCGRVAIGREMTVGAAALRSYKMLAMDSAGIPWNPPYLLQQVCSKHKNFCIGSESLNSSEIAHPLLVILW